MISRVHRAIGCVLLCALTLGTHAAFADATDNYVRGEMANKHIPGVALAVMRDGHVIKESYYGLASVELKAPITANSVFSLASMTKIFTASAIMMLIDEGRFSLDTTISSIVPGLPTAWATVTVRNCLSHTSGLPDLITDDINLTVVDPDRETAFKALGKVPMGATGVASVYNETGYVLLSMLIEKVSGMTYRDFVTKRILETAGLKTARFGDSWSIIPDRTELYTNLDITPDHLKLLVRDGRPVVQKDGISHYGSKYFVDYLQPAAALNASLRDLEHFETALAQGTLLKPATQHEMEQPYHLSNGKEGEFGLGFVTARAGPYATASYGGGAATWRVSIPTEHLTVIVLTNLQGCQPDHFALGVAAQYLPGLRGAVQP
jgi:CubicO group peptidase (beta-lactamase class C family)